MSAWCYYSTATMPTRWLQRGAPGRIARRGDLRSPIGRLTSAAGGSAAISLLPQLMIICTFRARLASATVVPQSDVGSWSGLGHQAGIVVYRATSKASLDAHAGVACD